MIALLGPKGTYTELALTKYLEKLKEHNIDSDIFNHEIVYYNSIKKIGESNASYLVLPIENTIDGYVIESIDALIKNNYHILNDLELFISFSLTSNVDIDNINNLYVQFKAKNQCSEFIEKNDFKNIIICQSNIEALEKSLNDKYSAAIIPTYKVSEYHYKTVINNITDYYNNYTRFFILSKNEKTIEYKEKCSLVVYSKVDEPGLLFKILEVFNEYGINLVSIISRPTSNKMGVYNFFIECLLCNDNYKSINNLCDRLNNDKTSIRILGIYNKIE